MTAAGMMEAHRAISDERSQVVAALCSAFHDDRIYRWLVPDDAQRRRSAAIFYQRFVDADGRRFPGRLRHVATSKRHWRRVLNLTVSTANVPNIGE